MKTGSIIGIEPITEGEAIVGLEMKVAGIDATERLMFADMHGDVRSYATFHGMKQRIADAAALSRDVKTGKPATPAEKFAAMQRVMAYYASGASKWARTVEAGPKGGFLFEALCSLYGHMRAPSEIRAWLDNLSDKDQAALREDDQVAPVIARIKAEKAAKVPEAERVNTKSLLGSLTAAPQE